MRQHLPRDYNKENDRPINSYVNQNCSTINRPISGGNINYGKKPHATESRYPSGGGNTANNNNNNHGKFTYLQPGGTVKQNDLVNRSKSPPKSRGNSPALNSTDKEVSPLKKSNIFFEGRVPISTNSRLYPQSCKNSNISKGTTPIEPTSTKVRTYSPKAGSGLISPVLQRISPQNAPAGKLSKRGLHQSKFSTGVNPQLNLSGNKSLSDSNTTMHKNQLSLYLNYFNNASYQPSTIGSISSPYNTVTSDKILSSIKTNLPNNSLLLKKLLEKKTFIEAKTSETGIKPISKSKITKQKYNSELPSKQLSNLLNSTKQREVREMINKVKQRPNLTLQEESGSFRLDNVPTPNKSAILIDHPPIFPRNRTDEISIGADYSSKLEAKRRAKRKSTLKSEKQKSGERRLESEIVAPPAKIQQETTQKLEPFKGQLQELNTLINELNQAENQQNIELFHTRLEMLENKIVNIKTKINSNCIRRQSGDRKNFANSIFLEASEEKLLFEEQQSESNSRSSPVDVTLKELVYRIENSNSSFLASKETSILTKSPRNEQEEPKRMIAPNSFLSDIPEERCRFSTQFIKEGVCQLKTNMISPNQLAYKVGSRIEEANFKRLLERAELYYIRNMINSYFFDEKERNDVDLNTRYLLVMYREHFFQSMEAVSIAKSLHAPTEEQIKEKMLHLPKRRTHLDKKTLIFDLDETLIHCNEVADENSDVILSMKFPTGQTIKAGINIRPHVHEVLETLSRDYEIIVFTASHSSYANAVVDHLDKSRQYIHHILSREHCITTEQGLYIKDLRILKDRQLKDLILVDNVAYSFAFQLNNGIPILPFYDFTYDNELLHLSKYLKLLLEARDVREYNKNYFKLDHFSDYSDPDQLLKFQFRHYFELCMDEFAD